MKAPENRHFFTLNKEISDLFVDYVEKNTLDKSKLIEKLIIEYLKDKKIIHK